MAALGSEICTICNDHKNKCNCAYNIAKMEAETKNRLKQMYRKLFEEDTKEEFEDTMKRAKKMMEKPSNSSRKKKKRKKKGKKGQKWKQSKRC